MNKVELVKRYTFFLLGLFISSLGVSLVTKASLGTSPISSIPYVLSLGFTPTLGQFTLLFSALLIILQLVILKKNFPKQYWLQIPVSLLFSYFIDLTMFLLTDMQPVIYLSKIFYLLLGCLILGLGVFMEVVGDVVMLPGESFVNAICKTYHTDFGKTKVIFDCTMTIVAIAIGILFFHQLIGVGVGTIIAALFVGIIARFLKVKFGFIEKILLSKQEIIIE